jgi:hypothetical protein
MKFPCRRHLESPAVLIAGYNHCEICSRDMEREILVKWCQHVKPEFTRGHILKVLGEMFGTVDFGFSTFPALYPMFPRAIKKPKKNDFGFILSQTEYLQRAFLTFIKGGNSAIDPLCPILPNQE